MTVTTHDAPASPSVPSPAPAATATAGPAVQLAHRALGQLLDRRAWAAGSQLPGERALAQRVGVSRSSLRQALALLEEEGRLHSSPQRGWFVATDVVSEPPSVLKSFTDIARARGLTATARLLRREVRPAGYEEAARLRIAPAAEVLEIVRVRGLDDVPVCLDTTVLVRARAQALEDVDLTDRSLFAELEARAGVRVMHSTYTARADGAQSAEAELLRVPPGTPVLVGEEITYDQTDTPVLLGRAVYRGDAYRLEATLHRSSD